MKISILIKALFPVIYFLGGVLLLIGVLKPYPDFPPETDVSTVDSEIIRSSEGIYLFKLGLVQSPICEKMWVPNGKIIDFLNQNDAEIAKVGIVTTGANEVEQRQCLKLYSLSINDMSFFTYEDAANSSGYIKLFFKIVALVLIIASFTEARKLKKDCVR